LGDKINEELDFEDSDEDLLCSQELNNFVKEMGAEIANDQELEMDEGEILKDQDEQQTVKDNKGKARWVDQAEDTRKSSRPEANEDIRITDKGINRAERRMPS
jgi:dipeptidase